MKSTTSVLALVFLCSIVAFGQDMSGRHHGTPAAAPDPMVNQEWAKQRLAKSPRHQEWVKVKNGTREVNSFVVYPENKNKAAAVVVIHEIFGLSDWIQSHTDQLAEAGYVAIAPVSSLPTLYVIGVDGTIVHRLSGIDDNLEGVIERHLKQHGM